MDNSEKNYYSYPIVTQTIEPVYSNILLLATNQTIINNWWRKLVPIPLVATLDRNIRLMTITNH